MEYLVFHTPKGKLYCVNDGSVTKIRTPGGPTPENPWSKYFETEYFSVCAVAPFGMDQLVVRCENRTVDIIPFTPLRDKVFLIRRGEPNGGIALPGGHIDPPELPVEAALRELGEETLDKPTAEGWVESIGQFSGWVLEKSRGGRQTGEYRSITIPFVAHMKPEAVEIMKGSDDAQSGRWYSFSEIPWDDFHFGHHIDILKGVIEFCIS